MGLGCQWTSHRIDDAGEGQYVDAWPVTQPLQILLASSAWNAPAGNRGSRLIGTSTSTG
jgi:hypothetical protein